MSLFGSRTNQGRATCLLFDLMSMYMLFVTSSNVSQLHSSLGIFPNQIPQIPSIPLSIKTILSLLPSTYPFRNKLILSLCLSLFVFKLRCITISSQFLYAISYRYSQFGNIWTISSPGSTVPVSRMMLGYGKNQ